MYRICWGSLPLVVLLSSCYGNLTPGTWLNYTAPDNSYSVLIPEKYDTMTEVAATALGNLPVHTLNWHYGKAFHVYSIEDIELRDVRLSYIEIPPSAGISKEEMLRKSIYTFASIHNPDFSGDLTYAENVTINGCPGRYYIMEKEVGKVYKKIYFLKHYVAENRLYTLWVIAYKKQAHNPQISAFFNSFRINIQGTAFQAFMPPERLKRL